MHETQSKNKQKHVAIILPCLVPFGGVEKNFIPRIQKLLTFNFRVDVILINEPNDIDGLYPDGCRIINLSKQRLRSSIFPLATYLRKERPDFVHAAMWPLTSIAIIAKLISRSNTHLIVSDHAPLSLQYRHWGKLHNVMLKLSISLTYKSANTILTVSKGVAQDLSDLSGIDFGKFKIIYNSIAFPKPTNNLSDKLWNNNKGKRIIAVGNFKSVKNHLMLIRAFKQVIENRDAQLIILGTGELEGEMRALISELDLEQKISMPGHVSNVVDYYNSADLFVLSSNHEGFGNVIVEAMSCGLPVVSTDCPYGPSEILDGGKYGRLVPVGDEHAMADAMIKTLDEAADHEALKARAEKLSGAESLDAYIKLFTE